MSDSFYKQRDYQKKWTLSNPDKIKQYQKTRTLKKRERRIALIDANPELYILESTTHSAKARGLECNITVDDIVIPESCPLLNCLIYFDPETPNHPNTPSLDRIDNSKGYVKGNVWVISAQANVMKNSASVDQLRIFANNVLNLLC